MSDALLSPEVGTAFWAGSLTTISYCAKKLKDNADERMIPLMGVLGAFIFAAQMINFTIPGTGSSGHLGGGLLLSILLGPHAAFLSMASVLTIQSFFFADGGILALGCNIWNLGIYPCFVAYPLIYRHAAKGGNSRLRIITASVTGAVTGLQLGALSVVLETVLSGKSELPFASFAAVMLPIHLAVGAVEGFITAGVITYVRKARPEILTYALEPGPFSSSVSIKKILLMFLVVSVMTAGLISRFASKKPDGLEWSINKTYGRQELPAQGDKLASQLKKLQEKIAFLPGYNFRTQNNADEKAENSSQRPGAGTPASGLIGSGMALGLILILGVGIKIMRRKKN